jgi:hypothetical protein
MVKYSKNRWKFPKTRSSRNKTLDDSVFLFQISTQRGTIIKIYLYSSWGKTKKFKFVLQCNTEEYTYDEVPKKNLKSFLYLHFRLMLWDRKYSGKQQYKLTVSSSASWVLFCLCKLIQELKMDNDYFH